MAENTSNKLFEMGAAARSFGLDMIKWDECALWVISQLHPTGARCPHCSAEISSDRQGRFFEGKQLRCPDCSKKFTALTGTLLNGSKLELREIYLIAVLSSLGVSGARIAAQLHCHVDTVTNWQHHFQAQQELAGA